MYKIFHFLSFLPFLHLHLIPLLWYFLTNNKEKAQFLLFFAGFFVPLRQL